MKDDYILEEHAGAPLVVSFAFNWSGNEPEPYLGPRLQRLELLTGRKLSKLFLQDRRSHWYIGGADGTGRDAHETARFIRDVRARVNAPSITTIGESMGAYGALLVGTLAGAESIIALAPVSFFNVAQFEQYGDLRYHAKAVEAGALVPSLATDLALLSRHHALPGAATLVFGTQARQRHIESASFDVFHAWRIKSFLPTVELHVHPEANHLMTLHLRERGILDRFLRERIPGLSPDATSPIQNDDTTVPAGSLIPECCAWFSVSAKTPNI